MAELVHELLRLWCEQSLGKHIPISPHPPEPIGNACKSITGRVDRFEMVCRFIRQTGVSWLAGCTFVKFCQSLTRLIASLPKITPDNKTVSWMSAKFCSNQFYDFVHPFFQVNVTLRRPGTKLEHQGIKIEFIGQIGRLRNTSELRYVEKYFILNIIHLLCTVSLV